MGLHDQLPVINCHADCNPPCDVRWSKIDSQSGPSTNGTLILGNIGKDSFGEHYCLATRNGTRHSGIASVLIMEEKGTVICLISIWLSIVSCDTKMKNVPSSMTT